VSILPSTLDYSASPREGHALSDAGIRHFSRGRYALGEAYRLAGLDKQGALLAPAYHCVTMLDPALAIGAEVRLYSLTSDLMPDPSSLEQLFSESAQPVKALLATHFFGFVRDFSWLKQWCDEREIVLIEDCSHVLFIERYQASGAGLYGKFIAASPYKFFPSADGGLLYAPEANLLDDCQTESAGFLAELRGIKCTIEKSRMPIISTDDIDLIDRQLESFTSAGLRPGNDQRIERSAHSTQYLPISGRTASLRSSRWLTSHSSVKKNITRRQENFQSWLKALSDVPNCHALYGEISPNVVPYMFPLYLDTPMPHFYQLKHLGVPVWRWDEMAISNCPVAADYRLHLIHLPCHQSLTEEDMAWMVAAVSKTLSFTSRAVEP